MVWFILIGSVGVLIISWWYLKYFYYFNTMWGMPTPKLLLPIVGNLLEVSSPSNAYFDLHRVIKTEGNYKTIRGALGLHFGVFSSEPNFLEHIMTHPDAINKSPLYRLTERWLGTGLLTSGDNKWHTRRKLVTPAYHFKILEQFIDVFDQNGDILVKRLRGELEKGKTDIYPYISLCALDIICETAMGTQVHAQENSNSEYVRAVKEMSRIVLERALSVFKQVDFLFRLRADYRLEQKALQVLHGYTLSVIHSRRSELVRKAHTQTQDVIKGKEDIGAKKKVPFLELLLQAKVDGKPLSDEDIREEVDTFMFEGHDTVSAAISFCIHCLSTNPKIQENVIVEQREIYGNDPNQETTYSHLNQMKYLEMVIKETMRLYPSVPLYGRVVTQDIKYGDYVLKKGLELGLNIYTLHRNPEIYPNPESFDPLRFTPEMQAKRHPFAYLAFSAGHRNCIGQKFAMLEMKSILSKLVRNYVFTAPENKKLLLKSGIILTTTNGVNITIDERKW